MVFLQRAAEWVSAATLAAFSAMVLIGIYRGSQRPRGTSDGIGRWYTKTALVALMMPLAVLMLWASYQLWRPIPLLQQELVRAPMVGLGILMEVAGVALLIWGRVALADMWDVSSSLGAELFTNHRLVTSGPYAHLRHPMYVGWFLAVTGALLLYWNWTLLLCVVLSPNFIVRAHREDKVLERHFGEAWRRYRDSVPGWIPRLHATHWKAGPA